MSGKSLSLLLLLGLIVHPAKSLACGNHMYFNVDEMGFLGRAAMRMSGAAQPAPVVDLKYKEMSSAAVGETKEITIQFMTPLLSGDFLLQVSGTSNLRLPQREFTLQDREGTVSIPYEVVGPGYETIRLTVTGKHKGQAVRETGRVYVIASEKPAAAEQELVLSDRS